MFGRVVYTLSRSRTCFLLSSLHAISPRNTLTKKLSKTLTGILRQRILEKGESISLFVVHVHESKNFCTALYFLTWVTVVWERKIGTCMMSNYRSIIQKQLYQIYKLWSVRMTKWPNLYEFLIIDIGDSWFGKNELDTQLCNGNDSPIIQKQTENLNRAMDQFGHNLRSVCLWFWMTFFHSFANIPLSFKIC